MSLSDAAMVVAATALRNALGGMQLHTISNPGVGGAAGKSSAAMAVPVWTTPTADGDFELATELVFAGAAPNGPILSVSLWSNTSGLGVWYGNFVLTGDLTADSAGNYTLESFTLNGSAS